MHSTITARRSVFPQRTAATTTTTHVFLRVKVVCTHVESVEALRYSSLRSLPPVQHNGDDSDSFHSKLSVTQIVILKCYFSSVWGAQTKSLSSPLCWWGDRAFREHLKLSADKDEIHLHLFTEKLEMSLSWYDADISAQYLSSPKFKFCVTDRDHSSLWNSYEMLNLQDSSTWARVLWARRSKGKWVFPEHDAAILCWFTTTRGTFIFIWSEWGQVLFRC